MNISSLSPVASTSHLKFCSPRPQSHTCKKPKFPCPFPPPSGVLGKMQPAAWFGACSNVFEFLKKTSQHCWMDFFQIYKLKFQMGSQYCQMILRPSYPHHNIFTFPFYERTTHSPFLWFPQSPTFHTYTQLVILFQAS